MKKVEIDTEIDIKIQPQYKVSGMHAGNQAVIRKLNSVVILAGPKMEPDLI